MQLGTLNSSITYINPGDIYVSFPEDKRDYTVIREGESSFVNNTFHMTVLMLLQNQLCSNLFRVNENSLAFKLLSGNLIYFLTTAVHTINHVV